MGLNASSIKTRIETEYRRSVYALPTSVLTPLPLKQGLKPKQVVHAFPYSPGLNASSIKTRIETSQAVKKGESVLCLNASSIKTRIETGVPTSTP